VLFFAARQRDEVVVEDETPALREECQKKNPEQGSLSAEAQADAIGVFAPSTDGGERVDTHRFELSGRAAA
jgi:hypothetical protein